MKKIFFVFVAFIFAVLTVYAEKTPVKSLYSYKLNNGLTLFVAENHAVPLTYIEVAVRCGAFTQNSENVGVFHLYEHMMFKGNSLYKNAAEMERAASDMGVSDKNGQTSIDYVKYYFTVPSHLTEKGLEYWNAAIRFPNLDVKEFENEKKVVIAEINGKNGESDFKIYRKRMNLLFPEHTYTTDSGGTEEYIKNATVKQLKDMLKKYYIPNNSALFVAGDVNPDEVYAMVKKIFGSWKKGKNPFDDGIILHTKTPFSSPELRVQPFDKISEELASVSVVYRGPDAATDLSDTYAADILFECFSDPQGYFKQAMFQNPLIGIPDTTYVGGGYPTMKTTGTFSFYADLVNPEQDIAERAMYFAEQIPVAAGKIAQGMNRTTMDSIAVRLEDRKIIEAQTAKGLISALEYFWLCADENYHYSYIENMKKVSNENLIECVNKYLYQKNPVITVLVNPKIYEKTKEQFEKAGFKLMLSPEE